MCRKFLRHDLPFGDPFPVASGHCVAKLDQNESPNDLPSELKRSIQEELTGCQWNRYPQPSEYMAAKRELGITLNLDPGEFAITVGCDEAIQGMHFVAGGPGRAAVVFYPTYPMLGHAARMAGTRIAPCILSADYHVPVDPPPDCHLILLANPNNPTGNLTPDETIEKLLDHRVMVFLDEAYHDFSGKTWVGPHREFPNLAIGRSFSKALLAGIRMGLLIGPGTMIQAFESIVTAPYHLGHLQLIIARRYSMILPHVQASVARIIQERRRLVNAMTDMGVTCYPSSTNFILFRVSEPDTVYRGLLQQGVRIRNMARIRGLESHLRVTAGTIQENNLFISALKSCV